MTADPAPPQRRHAARAPAGGEDMIAYGPVPSRRLGRSLGINNIPPKICTYACSYCQVGRTLQLVADRGEHYAPAAIEDAVAERIDAVRADGEEIDYLSFVPDGEPTLDRQLGDTIERLRRFGIRIAVITNGSLLSDPEVRRELALADWVSLKVDTVDEPTWRRLNRPHRTLHLEEILAGMAVFGRAFKGTLTTETMLVAGVNDSERQAVATAEFLDRIEPDTAFLAVPTRPPARRSVRPPSHGALARCFAILDERLPRTEYLIGYEGHAFAAAGPPDENLLSITAVHPMREEAVAELLAKAGADWSVVERLLESGELLRVEYDGCTYYLRRPARS
jgi:wyosine [tRNA(Phe)-imidazoG37] synthetase (radical SAM superfamily)